MTVVSISFLCPDFIIDAGSEQYMINVVLYIETL